MIATLHARPGGSPRIPERWQWGLAAFVSQIGSVALPKEILSKVEADQVLTDEEKRLYESHPEVAGKLLAAIPRLEDVAAMVTVQFGPLSFSGKPENVGQWDMRGIGQLLLRTLIEFDRLIVRGATREAAAESLRASKVGLPTSIIKALTNLSITNQE